MLIILDLNAINDLDLNSARNKIVLNELWHSFEQNLAFIICKNLSENLKNMYQHYMVYILAPDKFGVLF